AFYSNGGYDRDALAINGNWILKFRTGEAKVARVTLEPGLVPIEIIGYVLNSQVDVQWTPPGQRELSPIPTTALFHRPEDAPGVKPLPIATVAGNTATVNNSVGALGIPSPATPGTLVAGSRTGAAG